MPMSIFTLLVVDDEPNIVFSLKETWSSPTLKVISAGTAREGIDLVKQKRPDVVMLDVRLPDQSGLDAYDKIRQIDPRLPVIIMTAFARTETAIEAMRRGAYEYLVKPVDFKRLKEVLAKALEVSRLSRVPAVLAETDPDDLAADRIIGLSPVMQEVYKDIGRIAPQDSTVLILGESGTGKELVARALYHYSKRSQQPFDRRRPACLRRFFSLFVRRASTRRAGSASARFGLQHRHSHHNRRRTFRGPNL